MGVVGNLLQREYLQTAEVNIYPFGMTLLFMFIVWRYLLRAITIVAMNASLSLRVVLVGWGEAVGGVKSLTRSGICLCIAALMGLLTACSKEIDVKGEVFYAFGTNVIRRPGTQVFFLTEKENEAFGALINKRRDERQQESFDAYRVLTNQIGVSISFEAVNGPPAFDSDPVMVLHRKHFPNDDRTIHKILLEIAREMPEEFKQFHESVKHWIQVQMPLSRDALDLEVPEQISFLLTCKGITAGSDARFHVRLKKGQTHYVVAENWWFRFVPNGQELVLSDENRYRE